MSLEEYKKKRNFRKTPEPPAQISRQKKHNRFVVQRHQASRLHYDLRLEINGVLKSWAIPKGPSLNPRHKRLAIQTEDHPVKYLDFEGVIPKGNYGAGVMHIWDKGYYKTSADIPLSKQWEEGNIKLHFEGKNIQGDFALVKAGGSEQKDQWLLIKKKDKYATDKHYDAEKIEIKKQSKADGRKPVNKIMPMLATATDEVFDSPDWIYELKWDGYRAMARVEGGKAELYSRNGHSFNSKFSPIVRELENVQADCLLDGEIVALDQQGLPHFQSLQNFEEGSEYQLYYYVFDILYLQGKDLQSLPLLERKQFIPPLLEELNRIRYCDHIQGMGKAFLEMSLKKGMEGVIAKKADSTYQAGSRSKNWLKMKGDNSLEAVICGYTESDAQEFGSLILGIYEDDHLRYIGNCGTGFTDKSRKSLWQKLKKSERKTSPFPEKINLKGRKAHWVSPALICEVRYTEITEEGRLRHPSFKGLREDKSLKELAGEEKKVKAPVENTAENTLPLNGENVSITHPEKLYWPDEGLRKYDLLDYYLKVAEFILPHLKDRPQNLHRHPNGIKEKGFFQKDSGGQMPSWMKSIQIYSESSEKDIDYVLCQNEASLIYLANLGCIELNPWNSRVKSLDHPDYTVIDIDPSSHNTFEEVIEVALAAKEVLERAGIEGYPKTSGSSGIHIYIPLAAKYTYEEARDFTKILCQFIRHQLPDITSMERSPAKRKRKIYLDYMQNSRGQTLAAAYCLRPKPQATASAPLLWKEIKKGLDMRDYNIHTMPQRLADLGDLFRGVLGKGIDMSAAIARLE